MKITRLTILILICFLAMILTACSGKTAFTTDYEVRDSDEMQGTVTIRVTVTNDSAARKYVGAIEDGFSSATLTDAEGNSYHFENRVHTADATNRVMEKGGQAVYDYPFEGIAASDSYTLTFSFLSQEIVISDIVIF